jgi:hypothetical protein
MAALQTSGKCSHTHVCCAFPFGLTLDAYLNLSKIRYVIPLSGALGPDLGF